MEIFQIILNESLSRVPIILEQCVHEEISNKRVQRSNKFISKGFFNYYFFVLHLTIM